MARIVPIALTVATVAVGGGGCGDDAGEETRPVERTAAGEAQGPTKAEVISRADAICGQAKVAIDMARTRFHHGNLGQATATQLEQFVHERVVPVYRNELSSLGKLPVPAGDSAQFEEILSEAERANAQLAKAPEQISQLGGSPLFDDANRLARSYGLSVCVTP
jgi:hypothetical protein